MTEEPSDVASPFMVRRARGRIYRQYFRVLVGGTGLAIKEVDSTVCVYSSMAERELMLQLLSCVPDRCAQDHLKDDFRCFFDRNEIGRDAFDRLIGSTVDFACECRRRLIPIKSASVELRVVIHAEREYAGIAMEAETLKRLGVESIPLVISVYNDVD